MSDLFEEINAELKQERALELVKKYFPLAMFIASLIVIFVIISNYLDDKNRQKYEQLGQAYYKMLKIGDKDKKLFEESLDYIIKEQKGGYSALASFKKASLLIEQKKYQDALVIYDQIAAGDYKSLSSLSQIMAVNLILKNRLNEDDVLSRIEVILNKDHPFYESGLLLKAIYFKQQGKKDELSSMIAALNGDVSEDVLEKLNILVEDYDQK